MNWLDDLDKLIEAVEFGEVSLAIKRHAGKTANLIVNSAKAQMYPDSVSAIEDVLQLIKYAMDNKQNGNLSFTLVLKNGEVTRVIRQANTVKKYSVDT